MIHAIETVVDGTTFIFITDITYEQSDDPREPDYPVASKLVLVEVVDWAVSILGYEEGGLADRALKAAEAELEDHLMGLT